MTRYLEKQLCLAISSFCRGHAQQLVVPRTPIRLCKYQREKCRLHTGVSDGTFSYCSKGYYLTTATCTQCDQEGNIGNRLNPCFGLQLYPVGMYLISGAVVCSLCPAGYYGDEEGSSECNACGTGRFGGHQSHKLRHRIANLVQLDSIMINQENCCKSCPPGNTVREPCRRAPIRA